jgi:hypothetical protein
MESTASPTATESSTCSIHDPPGYIKPSLQDMLLTDITAVELLAVANVFEVDYLSPAATFPAPFPVEGVVYGRNLRLMVSLVCCRKAKTAQAINVLFLLDTGSPVSYLSAKAMEALIGNPESHLPQCLPVLVQSKKVTMCHLSPPDKHFADVNVLGMDFMLKNKLSLSVDYEDETFRLISGKLD